MKNWRCVSLLLILLAILLEGCELPFEPDIEPLILPEDVTQPSIGPLNETPDFEVELISIIDKYFDPYYLDPYEDFEYEGSLYEEIDNLIRDCYAANGVDLAEVADAFSNNPITDQTITKCLEDADTYYDDVLDIPVHPDEWFLINSALAINPAHEKLIQYINQHDFEAYPDKQYIDMENPMNFERSYINALVQKLIDDGNGWIIEAARDEWMNDMIETHGPDLKRSPESFDDLEVWEQAVEAMFERGLHHE